ncbi:flagellar hook-associated protein FlgK [Dongia sp.]|uniref:flagellar hook-associated protein FlgK n=1 Tax=Dongia sp. TaxID=1977262 RepID=UPI0035B1316A
MSLGSALTIATSSLKTTQTAISIASSNIANADVVGYTRKTAAPQTVVVGGISSGVSLSDIQRLVDAGLEKRTNTARTQSAEADVLAAYLSELSSALGSTTDDDTIASVIGDLTASLKALAISPESGSEMQNVVSDLAAIADSANQLTSSIQSLRQDADQKIADSVDTVNQALHNLDELNQQILRANAAGASTADLVDQQMQQVAIISGQINVSYFTDSNGAMTVYGPGGVGLLTDSVHELSFTATSGIDSTDIYDPSSAGGLSGISVGDREITSYISGGAIGGLLTVRDDTLVAEQALVDNLTAGILDAVNTAQNAGTSVPAPSTLTSSQALTGGDALNGTGTLRIALLDASGNVQSYTDLNLSAYATIDDLVGALDGLAGISASYDSAGKLVLSSDDPSLGIGMAQISGGVGSDNETLSAALGLNDLMTRDATGKLSVRSDILADPSLLAVGALSTDAALAVGDAGIAGGDTSAIDAMIAALAEDRSFPGAGGMAATTTDLASYAGAFISHVAVSASTAEASAAIKSGALSSLENSLASKSGVNLDEETAELEILQTNYQAAAKVVTVIQEMYDTLLNMV